MNGVPNWLFKLVLLPSYLKLWSKAFQDWIKR